MKKLLLIKLIFLLFFGYSYSQTGTGDATFNPFDASTGHGTGLDINDVVGDFYPDGKAVITGYFRTFNGIAVGNVIRLNADGTLDSSFNNNNLIKYGNSLSKPKFVKILTDGKILIGGDFINFNGLSANQLIRLNADGTLDSTFSTSDGFYATNSNAVVFDVAQQSDGKLIVGGNFLTYRNVTTNNLIRLNTDGTLDTSFSCGSGAKNSNNLADIYTIEVLSNGKIAIGGSFTFYNNMNSRSLAVLNSDGSIDGNFNTSGSGIEGQYTGNSTYVHTIKETTNGNLYVGGNFKYYNNLDVKNVPLVRINSNGSLDSAFSPQRIDINRSYSIISSVKVLADNSILVGGDFNILQGFVSNSQNYIFNHYNIAHLYEDGSLNTNFKVEVFDGSIVSNINKNTDNTISFVCATKNMNFLNIGAKGIIKVNTLGEIDTNYHKIHGLNGFTTDIKVLPDDKILVSGELRNYNQTIFENSKPIIRLTKDGLLDTSFNFNDPDFYRGNKLEALSNGKIATILHKDATVNRSNFLLLNSNGSIDSNFNLDSFVKQAYSFIIQPDDKILMIYENNQNQKVLSRFNTNGTKDSSFTEQIINLLNNNNIYFEMALQSTGKILIVGQNMQFPSSANYYNLLRLNANGTFDTTFEYGAGFYNSYLLQIAVTSNDYIYLANTGIEYNTVALSYIARLTPNGAVDTTFSAMHHYVNALFFSFEDIKVDKYDNAYFITNSYHQDLNYKEVIVKFNANGTYNNTFTYNLSNAIEGIGKIDFQKDNKIVVLSGFDEISGLRAVNIGRIKNCDESLTSVSISQTAGVLSSTITNQELQWVRCDRGNEIIENATSQSFTPTTNGSYALVAKNGGCPVQSNCIEITNLSTESFDVASIKVYPNPTNGLVNITLPNIYNQVETEIYDITGRLINAVFFYNVSELPLQIKGASGMYNIKIKTAEFTISKKVILK